MTVIARANGKKFVFDGNPTKAQIEQTINEYFAQNPQLNTQYRNEVLAEPTPEFKTGARGTRRAQKSKTKLEQAQEKRLAEIPELLETGLKSISPNLGMKEAAVLLSTFDPEEAGAILRQADPNIGMAMTPEGERIIVNNATGKTASLNKLGISKMDLAQAAGQMALFSPAGRGATTAAQVAGAMGTQLGVEAAHEALGGDVDVAPVLMAGAAVPVARKVVDSASAAIKGLRQSGLSQSPGQSWAFGFESAGKKRVREAIERGEDEAMAKYMITGANKIKANPVGREALRQGIDEGLAGPMSAAPAVDKQAFSRMIKIVEKGTKNKQFRNRHRPSDVLGDTIQKRYGAFKKLNKDAGSQVEAASKTLQGKTANIDEALGSFYDGLEKLGVTVGDDFKPSYGELAIDGAPKAFIEKVLTKLKIAGDDAFKLHKLKRIIDEDVSYAKVGEGLAGRTDSLVKQLRRDINLSLGKVSDKYRSVNTKYSDTKGILDDMQSAMGRKYVPGSYASAEHVGNKARGLLNRTNGRTQMLELLYNMDEVGKKYGTKFDDSVSLQVAAVDELERLFPSFAPKSFEGQIERATGKVASAITGDRAAMALRGAGKLADKARGINEENLLKALKKLSEMK